MSRAAEYSLNIRWIYIRCGGPRTPPFLNPPHWFFLIEQTKTSILLQYIYIYMSGPASLFFFIFLSTVLFSEALKGCGKTGARNIGIFLRNIYPLPIPSHHLQLCPDFHARLISPIPLSLAPPSIPHPPLAHHVHIIILCTLPHTLSHLWTALSVPSHAATSVLRALASSIVRTTHSIVCTRLQLGRLPITFSHIIRTSKRARSHPDPAPPLPPDPHYNSPHSAGASHLRSSTHHPWFLFYFILSTKAPIASVKCSCLCLLHALDSRTGKGQLVKHTKACKKPKLGDVDMSTYCAGYTSSEDKHCPTDYTCASVSKPGACDCGKCSAFTKMASCSASRK